MEDVSESNLTVALPVIEKFLPILTPLVSKGAVGLVRPIPTLPALFINNRQLFVVKNPNSPALVTPAVNLYKASPPFRDELNASKYPFELIPLNEILVPKASGNPNNAPGVVVLIPIEPLIYVIPEVPPFICKYAFVSFSMVFLNLTGVWKYEPPVAVTYKYPGPSATIPPVSPVKYVLFDEFG